MTVAGHRHGGMYAAVMCQGGTVWQTAVSRSSPAGRSLRFLAGAGRVPCWDVLAKKGAYKKTSDGRRRCRSGHTPPRHPSRRATVTVPAARGPEWLSGVQVSLRSGQVYYPAEV